MPSPRRSSGSPTDPGTRTAPARSSSSAIPALPSFSCERSSAADTPAGSARCRLRQTLDQRENLRRHREAAAKAAPRCRALGSLVVTALALVACLMAAHADRVDRQQQQQWEEVR